MRADTKTIFVKNKAENKRMKRNNNTYLFLVFLCTLLNTVATAQRSDLGAWYAFNGNYTIGTKWNWWNDIQFRNYDAGNDFQQFAYRTGIGYNLTENNNNVLLGYAYFYSEPYIPLIDKKTETKEHRIYQQYITRQNFGIFFLRHRYRIEERFFEKDNQLRFRYSFSVNVPLNNKLMSAKTFYFAASDEIFLHNQKSTFDRNRVYGGIGYVINAHFTIESGFMAQTLESGTRNQILVTLTNALSFLKK